VAGDLLLALPENDAGEVADLLAPEPEVGVDPLPGKAPAEASQTTRPRRTVGLLPGPEAAGGRRGGEVGG